MAYAPPEEIELVAELHRRFESLRPLAERATRPVAAHLRIESGGRVRDVLLGSTAAPAGRPPVVDWESAPLAGVFFETREGDDYELELADDRVLEGRVLERNLLLVEAGELVEVITEHGRCIRSENGLVVEALEGTLRPREEGKRQPRKVQLDAAQQAIVDLPARSAALVLGEAGAGKTTVAVHRIQKLLAENPRWRAAVIVPTEPLRNRIEQMLSRVGVNDIDVFDFDRWAAIEARRVFQDLPGKESRATPAGVVRIKRDPALRVAMKTLVDRWPAKKRGVVRDDLGELFGDRALLERMAAHADPVVPIPAIDEVLAHTSIQFSESTEEAEAGADAESLTTADGASIDEGTALADAGTMDPEDPPVLFALDRMHAEATGRKPLEPRRFDLLFVDEAQELGPFELELIGRAHRGSLIVAGDAGQQVDPSANFRGWDHTLADLGVPHAAKSTLQIGYRCPPPIAEFSQALLDGRAAQASDAVRLVSHAHESHLVAWLVEELRTLRQVDPALTVGVVVRDAVRFSRILGRAMAIVGAEELRPGAVHVVSVLAAKGLEFDTVIVADADANSFPDTPASRRGLYVACTRATHQLVLAWAGKASPLLAAN